MNLPTLLRCANEHGHRLRIVPPSIQSGARNELAENRLPPELQVEHVPLWQVRLQMPESPSLWYDESTTRCRHYDLRPDACRAFETNSGSCYQSRAKWGVA